AAWRAGRFELPDYYLVLAREDTEGPDFHLGPLRSARPHRVVLRSRAGARPAGRRGPARPRFAAARALVAGPGRGDRDGPPVLPGQPGRRGRYRLAPSDTGSRAGPRRLIRPFQVTSPSSA